MALPKSGAVRLLQLLLLELPPPLFACREGAACNWRGVCWAELVVPGARDLLEGLRPPKLILGSRYCSGEGVNVSWPGKGQSAAPDPVGFSLQPQGSGRCPPAACCELRACCCHRTRCAGFRGEAAAGSKPHPTTPRLPLPRSVWVGVRSAPRPALGTHSRLLPAGLQAGSALFRHEIGYVLGQMQDEACVPQLTAALRSRTESPMVRHECAEALGAIAHPSCLETLRAFAQDEERVVRESCEVALDMYEYENGSQFQYADGLCKLQA